MPSVNTFALVGGDLDGLVIKRKSSFVSPKDESMSLKEKVVAEVNEMFDQGRIGAAICLFVYADPNNEYVEPGPNGPAMPNGYVVYRVKPILVPYMAPWQDEGRTYVRTSDVEMKISFGDAESSYRVQLSDLSDFQIRKMNIPASLEHSGDVLLSKEGFRDIVFPSSLVEDFTERGQIPNPDLLARISNNSIASDGETFLGASTFVPDNADQEVGSDYILKTLIPSWANTSNTPVVLSKALSNIASAENSAKPSVSDVIGSKLAQPFNDPAVVNMLFQVKTEGITAIVTRQVRLSIMVDTHNSRESEASSICAFAKWKRPKHGYKKGSTTDLYRELPSGSLSPDVD